MKIYKLFLVSMVFMGIVVVAQNDPEGLLAATKRGDVEHIRKVFNRDSLLKKRYGSTLACRAMDCNQSQVIEFLKDQGIDVDKALERHALLISSHAVIIVRPPLSYVQLRAQAIGWVERELQKPYEKFEVIAMSDELNSDDQDAE